MNLIITLNSNRSILGTAVLDGAPLAPCLGKSDNEAAAQHHNPARNSLLPYGDTPTGVYEGVVVPASSDVSGYGPQKRILLVAKQGDCVIAERNGREGLMCHGGDINPAYGMWRGLRPTFGCVRFSNADLQALLKIIDNPGVAVTVTVKEVG